MYLYDNLEATVYNVWKSQPMKWTRILLLWLVLISLQKKVDWPWAIEVSMIVSMFLFLPRRALNILATGKHVNHGGEYGLEISGPKKAIKVVHYEVT